MSAHGMKLARWSLWFWHDYLLITFCKLRRVGLAARRGLLAACLPTKFAHKASKNNFIDKSSSEGRGRAKPKSVDGLTSSCPNIHTCSEVTNIHIIRMESFGSFTSKTQGLNPAVFLISSRSSFLYPHICILPLSLHYLTRGHCLCSMSWMLSTPHGALGPCYHLPVSWESLGSLPRDDRVSLLTGGSVRKYKQRFAQQLSHVQPSLPASTPPASAADFHTTLNFMHIHPNSFQEAASYLCPGVHEGKYDDVYCQGHMTSMWSLSLTLPMEQIYEKTEIS